MLYHREIKEEVEKVLLAARDILHLCVQLGGTLSGEHGIGVEKLLEMDSVFSEKDLAYMADLKAVFDPEGILNPGKLIPRLKGCGESGQRPLLRYSLMAGC